MISSTSGKIREATLTYTSSVKISGLRVPESRTVAALLLDGVSDTGWIQEVVANNRLQIPSASTAQRVAALLRTRMEPLGPAAWRLIRDGDQLAATQMCFAGAVRNSRLLGDFLDLVIRDLQRAFERRIEPRHWLQYIDGCRGRDPDMPEWSDSTLKRLRSGVFSILAEGGYIDDSRSRRLQNVFVEPEVRVVLLDQDETYVLRCMSVSEVSA